MGSVTLVEVVGIVISKNPFLVKTVSTPFHSTLVKLRIKNHLGTVYE